jgi:hypothetical protein
MLLAGLARVDGYAGLEPRKRLDYTSDAALRLAGARWVWQPATAGSDTRGRWSEVTDSAPRVRFAESAPPSANCRMTIDQPGHMVIAYTCPRQQLMVTTESFHTGWRATVDGTSCEVVRVDGDFLGCIVPKGTNIVDFRFQSDSRRWGEWVSASGLGLLLCMFLVRTRTRRVTKTI